MRLFLVLFLMISNAYADVTEETLDLLRGKRFHCSKQFYTWQIFLNPIRDAHVDFVEVYSDRIKLRFFGTGFLTNYMKTYTLYRPHELQHSTETWIVEGQGLIPTPHKTLIIAHEYNNPKNIQEIRLSLKPSSNSPEATRNLDFSCTLN